MAQLTRLVVEIDELGLDGRREVLKLLNDATAEDRVQWTAVEVGGRPHQGVADVVFQAVTDAVAGLLVAKADAVVGPWCRRGLDKVGHRIRTESVESGASAAAGEPAGAAELVGRPEETKD